MMYHIIKSMFRHNLSKKSQTASKEVFESLALMTETMVFCYMGLCCLTGEFDLYQLRIVFLIAFISWDFKFVLLGILTILIGRACNTFPLAGLVNMRRKIKIPYKMHDL